MHINLPVRNLNHIHNWRITHMEAFAMDETSPKNWSGVIVDRSFADILNLSLWLLLLHINKKQFLGFIRLLIYTLQLSDQVKFLIELNTCTCTSYRIHWSVSDTLSITQLLKCKHCLTSSACTSSQATILTHVIRKNRYMHNQEYHNDRSGTCRDKTKKTIDRDMDKHHLLHVESWTIAKGSQLLQNAKKRMEWRSIVRHCLLYVSYIVVIVTVVAVWRSG